MDAGGSGVGSGSIPWLALDRSGHVEAVVYADTAVTASRLIPPGTSLYVGGPSPVHPGRPWWVENWPHARRRAGAPPQAADVPEAVPVAG